MNNFKFGSHVEITQKGFYEGATGVLIDIASSFDLSHQYYVIQLAVPGGLGSKTVQFSMTEIRLYNTGASNEQS